jgi:hypothetical protein
VWNAGETRVERPKQTYPPEVSVAINKKTGSITIPEARDDAQSTLLTGLSASGDSTYAGFISKLKTFEKTLPAAQKLYEGRDYSVQPAPRTFVREVPFIDCLEKIILPCPSDLR